MSRQLSRPNALSEAGEGCRLHGVKVLLAPSRLRTLQRTQTRSARKTPAVQVEDRCLDVSCP